ncbi:branched-chain amino acid ABC transporter permease [Candidatus Desantisbacteria bacterium]|nr:branched-chain amino acid ABC transporter permease [Candidatus Desantisbacteria bacterium]
MKDYSNSCWFKIRFGIFSAVLLCIILILQELSKNGWVNQYYLHILTVIGMNVILVSSLNLVNGYLGEFALGHAGFMACGAYTAAYLSTQLDLTGFPAIIVSLGAAIIAAGIIGYLIGLAAFKTVGDYLAIITLGFNMIIVNAIQNIDSLGGPRGFTGIPKYTSLFSVAVCLLATYYIFYHLVNSNFGRLWVAIRENSLAAELMGININQVKNFVFTIAAAFAGLAGGLWAEYQQFITPRSFDYIKTTELLVMLYLGGTGSLSGSILGVTVYIISMELLRNFLSFNPQLVEMRMIVSPLILIIIMITRQSGLLGNREWRWLRPAEAYIPEENITHDSVKN